jgi:hypothetical protein
VLVAAMVFYVNKGLALKRAIGLPIESFLRAAAPAMVAGLIMAAAVMVAVALAGRSGLATTPLARLLVGVVAGALSYGACLLTVARRELRLVLDQIAALRGSRGESVAVAAGAGETP